MEIPGPTVRNGLHDHIPIIGTAPQSTKHRKMGHMTTFPSLAQHRGHMALCSSFFSRCHYDLQTSIILGTRLKWLETLSSNTLKITRKHVFCSFMAQIRPPDSKRPLFLHFCLGKALNTRLLMGKCCTIILAEFFTRGFYRVPPPLISG